MPVIPLPTAEKYGLPRTPCPAAPVRSEAPSSSPAPVSAALEAPLAVVPLEGICHQNHVPFQVPHLHVYVCKAHSSNSLPSPEPRRIYFLDKISPCLLTWRHQDRYVPCPTVTWARSACYCVSHHEARRKCERARIYGILTASRSLIFEGWFPSLLNVFCSLLIEACLPLAGVNRGGVC